MVILHTAGLNQRIFQKAQMLLFIFKQRSHHKFLTLFLRSQKILVYKVMNTGTIPIVTIQHYSECTEFMKSATSGTVICQNYLPL